jgi:hypothetical protein
MNSIKNFNLNHKVKKEKLNKSKYLKTWQLDDEINLNYQTRTIIVSKFNFKDDEFKMNVHNIHQASFWMISTSSYVWKGQW